MAGSKQKFIYTDDANFSKIVQLDESNTRALGYTPVTTLEVTALGIPARLSKLNGNERYINVSGVTTGGKNVTRSIVVPKNDNTIFVSGGGLALNVDVGGGYENVLFQVTQSVGEAKKFAILGTDTGLDDGTQP
ncbi:MAG: hypothetical protein ACEQSC_00275 [Candidatus Nanopelagicaceae bacterium]